MVEELKGVDAPRKRETRGNPHLGSGAVPEGYYDTWQAADVLEMYPTSLRNQGPRNAVRRRIQPCRGVDLGLTTKDAAAHNRIYWPAWKVWAERHRRIKKGRITPMNYEPAYDYPCGV